MNELESKIQINDIHKRQVCYSYNHESFTLFNIVKQRIDKCQYIQVGDVMVYESRKYRVMNIYLDIKCWGDLFTLNSLYKVNIYSLTEQSDFDIKCWRVLFTMNSLYKLNIYSPTEQSDFDKAWIIVDELYF